MQYESLLSIQIKTKPNGLLLHFYHSPRDFFSSAANFSCIYILFGSILFSFSLGNRLQNHVTSCSNSQAQKSIHLPSCIRSLRKKLSVGLICENECK